MCYLITFKSTGILRIIDGHSSANSELPNFSNDSFLPYLQSFVLVRKLQKEVGRHFECSVRGVHASKYLPSMRSKNLKRWVQKIAGVTPLYSAYSLTIVTQNTICRRESLAELCHTLHCACSISWQVRVSTLKDFFLFRKFLQLQGKKRKY